MLVNFTIQNFGSVKDKQTLSFEATNSTELEEYYIIEPIKGVKLLKLGLIYGANASGKTTILKALDFLRDIILNPAEKKTGAFNFQPFLFDNQTPTQNTVLSIEFIQNQKRYSYTIELNREAIISEELYLNRANIFKRLTDVESQFTEIKFSRNIKKDKIFKKTLEANTLWNNTVLGGFLKTNIELFELKEVTDWFTNHLKPLILTKTNLENYVTSQITKSHIKRETIIEILKKADFNISGILIKEEDRPISDSFIEFLEKQARDESARHVVNELKKDGKLTTIDISFEHTVNESKYPLPFNLESQGTQRYYGFAGLLSLLINDTVIFPIDELESSLHPDLFVHFLLSFLINAKSSQIIATTHNREILNDKDIFRNDAIWFTDKNTSSATELYSLADFSSEVIRDTSSIYNAYKVGKLGGTPHLGDYFIDKNNEKE